MEEHSLTKPSSYCGVRSLTPSATVSRQRLTTSHPVTALHQPARRDAAKDGMTACSESIFQKKMSDQQPRHSVSLLLPGASQHQPGETTAARRSRAGSAPVEYDNPP